MVRPLSVEEFLRDSSPLFVVRSPLEFHHATIPSRSLPLFEDNERAIVGTLYKKKGEKAALLEGLKLTGPKLSHFAEIAIRFPEGARIFCSEEACAAIRWRGSSSSPAPPASLYEWV